MLSGITLTSSNYSLHWEIFLYEIYQSFTFFNNARSHVFHNTVDAILLLHKTLQQE